MGKHENHIFYSNGILVESAAAAVGLCCTHNAVFLKENLSSVLCVIASTFVEIVRYPINTVHWLSLRLDKEQVSSFTRWLTLWQSWLTHSTWVTDSSILGPVWCIQLIVLTVKGGSAVTNTTTTTILRPFVGDYPCEPVPEETLTHPPSWSSSNLYQLLPSTTIRSILLVQITCLAIFLHNLFPCPLWCTSWSGALLFIFHTFYLNDVLVEIAAAVGLCCTHSAVFLK